jgi:hypothetical protein
MQELTLSSATTQSGTGFRTDEKPTGVILHPFGRLHSESSLIRHVVAHNAENLPVNITGVGTQPMSELVESHHARIFHNCFKLNYRYELAEPITAITTIFQIFDVFGELQDESIKVTITDQEGPQEQSFNLWPKTQEMQEANQATVNAYPSEVFLVFLGVLVVRTKAGSIVKADPFFRENAINWALGKSYKRE